MSAFLSLRPTQRGRSWTMPLRRAGSAAATSLVASTAVVLGAVIIRVFFQTNVDVSWILTLCEQFLAGKVLYVDLLETNPPASILLYLPAIPLARFLGAAPETVVTTLVFASVFCSLLLSAEILPGNLREKGTGFFLPTILAVLLILPMDNFGEREHIALILMLPALCCLVARLDGARPATWTLLLAGLGAGAAVSIKPHFALALIFPELLLLVRLRSWTLLMRVENMAAAALMSVYAGVVLVFFYDYFTTTFPLVREMYIPVRHFELWQIFLVLPPFKILISTIALIALAARPALYQNMVLVPLLAAFGFFGSLVVQGKGWPYHGYPSIALCVVAVAICVATRAISLDDIRRRWSLVTRGLAMLLLIQLGQALYWFCDGRNVKPIIAAVSRLAPHPRIFTVTDDLALGHPLTRIVGGEWVSRMCSQWMSDGALRMWNRVDPSNHPRLREQIERERRMTIEDIGRGRPDVILVDHFRIDWREWITEHEGLRTAFADYRLDQTLENVDIWVRRNADLRKTFSGEEP